MMETNFITVREAAIIRGCGIARIYSLLWSHKLQGAVKGPDNEWRIPRASVERKHAQFAQGETEHVHGQ